MSDDLADVTALYQGLLDAWNRRAASDYGNLFSENGTVVGFDGSQMRGGEDIAAQLEGIFGSHPTATYVAKVQDVRLIAPGVAILSAAAGMVPPGGPDINPVVNAIQVLVATDHGGEWRIESFQNTPAAFHGRPEMVEAMTEELRAVLRETKPSA